MDLLPDRYRLLKGEAAKRFLRLASGEASKVDIALLAEQNIHASNISQPVELALPTVSAFDLITTETRSTSFLRSAFYQLHYKRRLRFCALHELLEELAAQRAHLPVVGSQRSLEIAAASVRAMHIVSAQDQCLPRSLAMTYLLRRDGIAADLVFGVTMPFAAHCWVQQGDMVLSDTLERVRPFRPIMVV